MSEVWARIEAVLRVTAPALLAALPAGASPEAIAAAELRIGVELPAAVRETYAAHDGSGGIDHGAGIIPYEYYGPKGFSLLSLDEMLCIWQMWRDWAGEVTYPCNRVEGPVKAEEYNARWVPISDDGGCAYLCIDLDPAPGGVPGQVIFLDHTHLRCTVAESWRAFLEKYAADLESGRLRFKGDELVAGDEDAEYSAVLKLLFADRPAPAPTALPFGDGTSP